MTFISGISKIYRLLLRLFPRDFQNEFGEEMEDVFNTSLEQGAKISAILVIRACFFELIDLPVNLVVEHLSSLRKGNIMKTTSFEISRIRVVLMGAVGMMMGWLIIAWEGMHFSQLFNYVGCIWMNAGNCRYSNILNYSNRGNYDELLPWLFYFVDAILYSLPMILCGLMLGIAVGVERRLFKRIALLTAVGGILGSLVTIPVKIVANDIMMRSVYLPTKQETPILVLSELVIICVYGFVSGAGLGFTFEGWKTRLKFAWIGLTASAIGELIGYFVSSLLAYEVPLGPSYIHYGILGILAGGILGWFFGQERQPEVNLVMGTSHAG